MDAGNQKRDEPGLMFGLVRDVATVPSRFVLADQAWRRPGLPLVFGPCVCGASGASADRLVLIVEQGILLGLILRKGIPCGRRIGVNSIMSIRLDVILLDLIIHGSFQRDAIGGVALDVILRH